LKESDDKRRWKETKKENREGFKDGRKKVQKTYQIKQRVHKDEFLLGCWSCVSG
jgi:Zn ribbon nucleic-acid-binding protein